MQVYKSELKRLRDVRSLIRSRFPRFGPNKIREITRLVYEIAKREGRRISGVLPKIKEYSFLKRQLIKRRYPYASKESNSLQIYLPKLDLNPAYFAERRKKKFYPQRVFIEDSVVDSYLAKRFRAFFPRSKFISIASFKDYRFGKKTYSLKDYNRRRDNIFIVSQLDGFFKSCPCTKGAKGCGYHIFNLGFGCIFECNYCYLQEYTNAGGIILPANIDNFFNHFRSYKRDNMRIGTGEFSDSLALDRFTNYSLALIDYFSKYKKVTFEFKTKSKEVKNILKAKHVGNIVVSWSLNPTRLIKENELFTSSLEERLQAARECTLAGYKVGFHFDPIVYYQSWRNDYQRLLDHLFSQIQAKDIAWISLGTFRFVPSLKGIIEKRFPQNKILDQELLIGYDGKLRYPYALRHAIYKRMLEMLFKHSRKLNLYLCMEPVSMWQELGLK